jgi:hypothetical protein
VVSVGSSLDPAAFQQSVTFTAQVDFTNNYFGIPAGAYAPEGTVTFYDGSTPLATETLQYSSGAAPQTATFTTNPLSPGAHAITARYNGDAPASLEQFDPATSAALGENVTGRPPTSTPPPTAGHHRRTHRARLPIHHARPGPPRHVRGHGHTAHHHP